MHGQFVWYELITPETEAAKKFYPSITGWGTQAFDNDYSMWTTAGGPFAGLYRLSPEMRQQGMPPHWLPYVEANNVDETAQLAASLGGKIVSGPSDVPNVGRYAVLRDPQGAHFGIYKASGPSRSWNGTPALGRFSWHELMTTDSRKAFEFYRRLFGWDTISEMDMGGGNMYSMYGKGQPFGGMFNRHGDMANMQPFWLVYIYVKDVKKAVDVATRNGAFVQRPPMEVPGGGTIAILGDPQGAAFALHSSAESAPEKKRGAGTRGTVKKRASAKKGASKKRPTAKKGGVTKKGAAKRGAGTRGAGKKRVATKKRGGTKKRSATKKRSTAKKRSTTKKTTRRRR